MAAGSTANQAAFISTIINDSGGVIHDTPNTFDTPPGSGTYNLSAKDFVGSDGLLTWYGAQAWVHYLDATNNQGYNDWRLPTTVDSASSIGYPDGGVGDPAVSSSELAKLFYGQLGQVAHDSITTTHNANYALFTNITIASAYFSGTESKAYPDLAYVLDVAEMVFRAPPLRRMISSLCQPTTLYLPR